MTQIWRVGAGGVAVSSLVRLREVLLAERGVGAHEVEGFFSPEYESSIHSPEELSGMQAARDRLFRAAEKRERVLVYGDYDADGITATALLVTIFRELGVQVIPYLPHRLDDGYGLNRVVLEGLLPEFDLLIAADCGISNTEEIAWLATKGKDVIVVDHHELPQDVPKAVAILHPRLPALPTGQAGGRRELRYPFPHLSGAGVAWKLAQGLLRDARSRLSGGGDRTREHALLDLAALGTIADVVPMIGENRVIARFGLAMLARRQRVGLACLLSACRLAESGDVTAQDVAFRVIPRLNAAGRMEHSQPALDLLLTQDARRARELTARLSAYNSERQVVTRRVIAEAKAHVDLSVPFVFAANVAWPAGVLGLAAARMAEEFTRPAIVVGSNGTQAVGSARGIAGGNVLRLLEAGRGHLLKLGGHARAAGFSLSVDNIPHFHEALCKARGDMPAPKSSLVVADALVDRSLLTWDLLELVESFAPFGEGNQEPAFVAREVPVLDVHTVGRIKEHLKLKMAGMGESIDAIGFGLAHKRRVVAKHIDVLFTVEANEYRGQRQLTLKLREIAPAGTVRVQG